MKDVMGTKEKARLISAIVSHLKFTARSSKKAFNEGDTFFALCFRSDKELRNIAKMAGV